MADVSGTNLSEIVGAPEFIVPWLDRFYEPHEIRILKNIKPPAMDIHLFQEAMNVDVDSLERLLLRSVFSINRDGALVPSDFHARYDIWALFEGFKDLPQEIRNKLNRWELDYYISTHAQDVEQIRQTGTIEPSRIIPRYLLLEETFEIIDEIEQIYLWPCNCRSMVKACKKPVFTCLRFNNSQGQGFEISREKAKEIVLTANKKGLMQSGELGRDADGKLLKSGAICNCCPECCFPHLLADELNAEKLWPVSCYTANWIEAECSFCGLCAKRCPFQAFQFDKRNEDAPLKFQRERCRGCGICAITCPTDAIEMMKINESLTE